MTYQKIRREYLAIFAFALTLALSASVQACSSGQCGYSGSCYDNGWSGNLPTSSRVDMDGYSITVYEAWVCVNGTLKKAAGRACASSGECASNNCVGGYCCNTGQCGYSGSCYDNGWSGKLLIGNQCDFSGDCFPVYETLVCVSGTFKKANGIACISSSQCNSNNCVDSGFGKFCCNTGSCGYSSSCYEDGWSGELLTGQTCGEYCTPYYESWECCEGTLIKPTNGYECATCPHISGLKEVTWPDYNIDFVQDYVMDGSTYAACLGDTMHIDNLGTYILYCSNGALNNGTTPSLFSWTYDQNATDLGLSHTTNFSFANDTIKRPFLIGQGSTTKAMALTATSRGTNEIYIFSAPGRYTVYTDLLHAYCDQPYYACPWLGGTWRTSICKYRALQTLRDSEGWFNVGNYSVIVPSSAINISTVPDVQGATNYNVSWSIINKGVGKSALRIYRDCAWWNCTFLGYTEGQEITLNEGQNYTIWMNANANTADPLASPTDTFGINVTYDDGYGLSCISPITAQGNVKVLCFVKSCNCNADACVCPAGSTSCCITNKNCVWNNTCYANTALADIDSDSTMEYCNNGTWFAKSNISDLSMNLSIIDRSKESPSTYDTIAFSVSVYDQDVLDRGKVYLTINNSEGSSEVNPLELSCIDTDINHWKCSYSYNPRNDAPLGNYSVYVRAVDKEGLVAEKTINNAFAVDDLSVSAFRQGNTTELYLTGTANSLATGSGITSIASQHCSQPPISAGQDAILSNVRLCGVNSFNPGTCLVASGNYRCYIQDIRLNETMTNFSYILTDNNHISGSSNLAVNVNGLVGYFDIENRTEYFNLLQNISYSVDFTNVGDISLWGNVANQTHLKVSDSFGGESKRGALPIADSHIVSSVDVEAGLGRHFNFTQRAYSQVGRYKTLGDVMYFWPELNNSYGFPTFNYSVANNSTTYFIAAIDINYHQINDSVLKGSITSGKIGGFFIASMDIEYWESVQAFRYRVTNETTTGIFWVDKVNLRDNSKVTEIPAKNLTWNPPENAYESVISTFDLSCDDDQTTHRVYYLVNWTEYNIYLPYVDGRFDSKYYPYYYQDFKVNCLGDEIFSVEPTMINVLVGTTERDIVGIQAKNPRNKSITVDILVLSKTLPEFSNWVAFREKTGYCEKYLDTTSRCRDTNLSIQAANATLTRGENSTVLRLLQAPRLGKYEFDIVMKDQNTGEEMGKKHLTINVYSEVVGSDSLIGPVLLSIATATLVALSLRREKKKKQKMKRKLAIDL